MYQQPMESDSPLSRGFDRGLALLAEVVDETTERAGRYRALGEEVRALDLFQQTVNSMRYSTEDNYALWVTLEGILYAVRRAGER